MITQAQLPELKAHLLGLLKEELLLARVQILPDGDIQFRFEGQTFVVEFLDKDPSFLRIILPGITHVPGSEGDKIETAHVCLNAINYEMKAIKIFRELRKDKDGDHSINASIEVLMDDPKGISVRTLERYLGMLKAASNELVSALGLVAEHQTDCVLYQPANAKPSVH